MKVIMVIDIDEMPKSCAGCLAYHILVGTDRPHYCEAGQRFLPDDCEDKRPNWCRLEELPKRESYKYFTREEFASAPDDDFTAKLYADGMETGWNACLDKILEMED